MKSKLFLLLLFVGSGFVTMNAQAEMRTNTSDATAVSAQDQQVEVAVENLPAAVRQTLSSDTYKDWTVSKAFHVTGASEHYVIHLNAGERENKIKLDKDGNVVE
jgi:hypothetical protein